jgi:hypothetical protein
VPPWVVRGSGVYDDRLVSTPQAWWFQSLVFTDGSHAGDLHALPVAPVGRALFGQRFEQTVKIIEVGFSAFGPRLALEFYCTVMRTT